MSVVSRCAGLGAAGRCATPVLLALIAALSLAAAPSDGGSAGGAAHVLKGAQAFRDGRFEEAVIEFEVARELGAKGAAGWYLAAALEKAGRSEDAVEAFERAWDEAPQLADPLLEYHWAVACSEAQLLTCALQHLEKVTEAAGPRVRDVAAQLRSQLQLALSVEPSAAAIDALIERARSNAERRPLLARAQAREAQALSARRSDRHGSTQAEAASSGGSR